MNISKSNSEPDNPEDPLVPMTNTYPPEARCHCGQLVAKLNDSGIELKCKRCKRLILLPFSNLDSGPAVINICENNENPMVPFKKD